MSADRRNLTIGIATLVALLLAAIVPNFRRGAASLSHPDPVGPTAYSKSAIGHLAFRRLLDEVGVPTSTSESGSGGYVSGDDVLVVAEPRTDDGTQADARAMLTARNVLLVLPKRTGSPDRDRPYWLADDKLLSDDSIVRVLHLADENATLIRDASLAGLTGDSVLQGSPAIEKPQLIRSRVLRPLLACPSGILIGERRTRTGRIVVLSDPDLIANFNLTHGDNAVLAVRLVEYLRTGHPDGDVIFDEFTHGFSERPFHLLGILFQFPFVLVTIQMGFATGLLVWAATGRFGTPTPPAPPLEAGKRSLIDNATRLLAQSGRIPELSERYFEEMVRDTGRRLRAPSGLDLTALVAWLARGPRAPQAPIGLSTPQAPIGLSTPQAPLGSSAPRQAPVGPTAPQHIWTWRKELLGESGTYAQLD